MDPELIRLPRLHRMGLEAALPVEPGIAFDVVLPVAPGKGLPETVHIDETGRPRIRPHGRPHPLHLGREAIPGGRAVDPHPVPGLVVDLRNAIPGQGGKVHSLDRVDGFQALEEAQLVAEDDGHVPADVLDRHVLRPGLEFAGGIEAHDFREGIPRHLLLAHPEFRHKGGVILVVAPLEGTGGNELQKPNRCGSIILG